MLGENGSSERKNSGTIVIFGERWPIISNYRRLFPRVAVPGGFRNNEGRGDGLREFQRACPVLSFSSCRATRRWTPRCSRGARERRELTSAILECGLQGKETRETNGVFEYFVTGRTIKRILYLAAVRINIVSARFELVLSNRGEGHSLANRTRQQRRNAANERDC